MRNYLAAVLSAALSFGSVGSVAAQLPGAAPRPAAKDSHEGITITVEPWTHAANYKEKFPKKSPFSGGVVALQVTLRNDSDESVKVDLQRIRLLVTIGEENRQSWNPLPQMTSPMRCS